MKMLIVTSYFEPEFGAAAVRIGNMADGLTKLGAEVDVVAPLPNYPMGKIFEGYKGRLYKEDSINDHRVFRYRTYATTARNPILRLFAMVSFAIMLFVFGLRIRLIRRYDRIIVQSPPLIVSCAAMLLFKGIYKKTVILNVSDLWPLSAVELGALKEGSITHKILCFCEKYIYLHSNGITCQSQEIADYIHCHIETKKVMVYRNLQPKS